VIYNGTDASGGCCRRHRSTSLQTAPGDCSSAGTGMCRGLPRVAVDATRSALCGPLLSGSAFTSCVPDSGSPLVSLHPGASRCGYLVRGCRCPRQIATNRGVPIVAFAMAGVSLRLFFSTRTAKPPRAFSWGISLFPACRKWHFDARCRTPNPLRQERQTSRRRQHGKPCVDPDDRPDQKRAGGRGPGGVVRPGRETGRA
jgi:hypothetical protein